MALPSFFKRKNPTPPASPAGLAPGDEAGPVQQARTRARRRLIGAVVLLAIGVIGFPMLFETQPRPLPADIPIELPRREGAAVRPPAGPRHAPAVTELPPMLESPASTTVASEGAAAGVVAAAPVSPPSRPAAVESSEAPKPEPAKPAGSTREPEARKPEPRPAEPKKPDPVKDEGKTDSERARAALEGRPAPAAASTASDPRAGRFVVQVGAYTDANTLREVRAKVEKLGLKTYTQSVDTDAGKRTRVRVGPFTTRQEAESAGAKLKGAGLPGNVLTL